MFWTLVGATVAIFIYFALIKPFCYWTERGVPSYNVWKFWVQFFDGLIRRKSVADSVTKIYNDFAGTRYSGLYQFYKPVLSVRDPDLIKQITVKDFDHFVDHNQFLPPDTEPILERNLVLLKGDKWRHMRATLSPSFTASKMKIMFGLISECGKQLAQYFQDQNSKIVTVEMKDVFTKFTNDVIASTAFGVKCDSLGDPENEFYRMGKKATTFGGTFKEIAKLLFFLVFPRLSKKLGMDIFNQEVISFFKRIVKDNIEQREKNGIVRPDMIHLLMEARRKSKTKSPNDGEAETENLSDIDITAQAMIFFFAGFEVVANLMSFMAYELVLNPDVQRRLQQEIDQTAAESEGTLTYEAVMKMKYMDMVISESLRKWPVALAMDRLCVKPYTIVPVKNGEIPVNLKTGDVIIIPIFGIHRDPHFYPEPNLFNPERFCNENKSNVNPYAYLPFGSGPRSCIGNRFAIMEIKLAFFHMLSCFDIVAVEKTRVPITLERNLLQLKPEGGFWMGLKQRNVT